MTLPPPKAPPLPFDVRRTVPLSSSSHSGSVDSPNAVGSSVAPPTSSVAPTALAVEPVGRSLSRRLRLALAAGAMLLVAFAVGAGALALRRSATNTVDERSVVRVVTAQGAGTGFFVAGAGPGQVYVVTAFHVVDSGARVVVERTVIGESGPVVDAYPETELVTFDAENDLALLRVKNLPATAVQLLELAGGVSKDEPIVSLGYPASTLTAKVGLLRKEGKLLDLTKLPIIDRIYGRIVRDGAIDGLLVSTDIEPGFSGGPTVDAKGRVVGVNVRKDPLYRGQNGAVSASAVRALIASVKPAAPPTPEDVQALLQRIQNEELLLPVGDRTRTRESEFVALSDMTRIRQLVGEMRQMEDDVREREIRKGLSLSGRAILGAMMARLPGSGFETYQAASTKEKLASCETRARRLESFFGQLGVEAGGPEAIDPDCARFAVRPVVWDLMAATLEWNGAPREATVVKLEEVDAEAKVYRASVRLANVPGLVSIDVSASGGRLALELFDKTGRLRALDSARGASPRDFEGTWTRKIERVPSGPTEMDGQEKLVIRIQGTDQVTMSHELALQRRATKAGVLFGCNHARTIATSGVESLSGVVQGGVVVGSSTKLDLSADGCSRCGLCAPKARLVVLKLGAGKLVLYRTDGAAETETIEFTKG